MFNLCKLTSYFCNMLFIFILNAGLYAQGIYFDFGTRIRSRYLQNVGNSPGSDGETMSARIGNEFCAQSIGTAIYFAIDNEILYQRPARTYDIINVEYYDASEREIKLFYDSVDDPNKISDIVITC